MKTGPEADGYTVSAAADGFSGANPRPSIDANALRQFVADLEQVERERRGEACLSASDLVNDAVRHALHEDQEDLAAFEERVNEPLISYEQLLNDLKKHGKI